MTISIINGPNLNMLGKRNPEIYGHETFEETLTGIRKKFPETEIRFFQSNSEGEIIDMIQRENADPAVAGIVLNPGAYAHYSFAIADAVEDSDTPVAEVHISNIHAREAFRATSVTARAAGCVITGCGRKGYEMAIDFLLDTIECKTT